MGLIEYNGWHNCVQISNGIIELIATTDVGPRVLHFGFVGKENLFYEFPSEKGLTGGSDWHSFGGHRIWMAPQVRFRPNEPDNQPIEYFFNEDGVTLIDRIQSESRIQKEMRIQMVDGEARVIVSHKITNWGVWPIELAVWAVTVFGNEGMAIWPIESRNTFYLPNNCVALWPWTKLNDPRFTMGASYMTLKQDNSNAEWFKVGVPNESGWGAFLLNGQLFVKKYHHLTGATYTDYASSLEVFCNEEILELESLSPFVKLDTSEFQIHTEEWSLFNKIKDVNNENDIIQNILPFIKQSSMEV